MKKIFKFIPITLGFIFLLILFTLSKLPEEKIQNYIEATVNNQLAPMGISMKAKKGDFNLWLGLKYSMQDVTLYFEKLNRAVTLQSVTVSPSFTSLFSGKLGANAVIKQGLGEISSTIAVSQPNYHIDFKAKDLNLAQLPAYSTGRLNANGSLDGNLQKFSDLHGNLKLSVTPLKTDEMTFSGITIPSLNVSEVKTSIQFSKGEGEFKVLQIGKKAEDIHLTGNGKIKLGARPASSTLDLDVNFSFADRVKKSVPLLDAFLGSGKGGNGSYAYKIRGPLTGPLFPTPL